MNRRMFLKHSMVLSGATLLSGYGLYPQLVSAQGDSPDWRMGWKSVETDSLTPVSLNVEGHLPAALNGTFLRNGPAKYERGGEHYRHWFDGDGMIQQYRIADGQITHRGQFIHTEKYLKEEKAGQFLYGGTGSALPVKAPVRNNDTTNTANISVIHWNNETLALWEGGSAWSFDAVSLQTHGIKTWNEDLRHMPFSAHPKVDPKGYLWNFGFIPYLPGGGGLIVYKLTANSHKIDYHLIKLPFAGYIHDFAQTDRNLVFYISPYHYNHEHGDSYVGRFNWQPELGGHLIVVDKNDLQKVRFFEAPAGFVFHFGQAWQKGRDIQIMACWRTSPTIMAKGMYDVLSADSADKVEFDHAHATLMTLNMQSGKCELATSNVELEFPGFDVARSGELVFGVGRKSGSRYHYANSTLSWNSITGKTDQYFFDAGIIAEEPLYIAAQSSSKPNSGWLLQTALNYQKARTEVYVFDASNIASGPVAVATMDRTTPLGFHGTFLA